MKFSTLSAMLILGVIALMVAPTALAYDSISGQAQACGYGAWRSGEQMSFSHSVSFSVTVDWDRGYVVDCVSGTDAYFEYRGVLPGNLYLYAVWGQLGDY